MKRLDRRQFVATAAAFGMAVAHGDVRAQPPVQPWRERRDLFPQGVASGDPHPDSVLLWTRASAGAARAARALTVEVAEDPAFERVVASGAARAPRGRPTGPAACSSAGSSPRATYWYRFIDERRATAAASAAR